jgi:dihydroorotate dehydrogenase
LFSLSLFSGSAVINRCGFNSEGIVVVAKRLGAQHGKRKMDETSDSSHASNPVTTANNNQLKQGGKAGPGILGVNLGKNKNSEDAVADYVQGVHTLSQYADYMVRYLTKIFAEMVQHYHKIVYCPSFLQQMKNSPW